MFKKRKKNLLTSFFISCSFDYRLTNLFIGSILSLNLLFIHISLLLYNNSLWTHITHSLTHSLTLYHSKSKHFFLFSYQLCLHLIRLFVVYLLFITIILFDLYFFLIICRYLYYAELYLLFLCISIAYFHFIFFLFFFHWQKKIHLLLSFSSFLMLMKIILFDFYLP